MTDFSCDFDFSAVAFHPNHIQLLKNVLLRLLEFDSTSGTGNEKDERKKATSILIGINNALVDDIDVISSFPVDLDLCLLLVKSHKFEAVDSDFCKQSVLFFNLVNQHRNRNDSSFMFVQEIPFFLQYLENEKNQNLAIGGDLFFLILKFIENQKDMEFFLQLFVRYDVFRLFNEQILNLKSPNSLSVLGFLKRIIGFTHVEMYLRGIVPALARFKDCGNHEMKQIAYDLTKVVKSDNPAPLYRFTSVSSVGGGGVNNDNLDDGNFGPPCPCSCGELTKCRFQGEVFPTVKFVTQELPGCSSKARGLFGRVTAQFGVLLVEPTFSKGIWQCTLRFVENKGICKIGLIPVSLKYPYGEYDEGQGSFRGALSYDNMGNYTQYRSQRASKKGWKKDAPVTVEVDMDRRQVCFYVKDADKPEKTLQQIIATNIPPVLRLYTWNINQSLVQIMQYQHVAAGAVITEQMKEKQIKWEDDKDS